MHLNLTEGTPIGPREGGTYKTLVAEDGHFHRFRTFWNVLEQGKIDMAEVYMYDHIFISIILSLIGIVLVFLRIIKASWHLY